MAIGLGTSIARGSTALGYEMGGMSLSNLGASVANFGFSVPLPAFGHVFGGIERQFTRSAVFALVGAALTFFGFIHGETIGLTNTPAVAASYLAVAGVLLLCSRFARLSLGSALPSEVPSALPEPAE